MVLANGVKFGMTKASPAPGLMKYFLTRRLQVELGPFSPPDRTVGRESAAHPAFSEHQEFPGAFYRYTHEKERAIRNDDGNIPNAEGGMRLTFPPYAKKIALVSLRNNKTTPRRCAPRRSPQDFSSGKTLVKPRWFWYKEWI
jgi:hypothetical protein